MRHAVIIANPATPDHHPNDATDVSTTITAVIPSPDSAHRPDHRCRWSTGTSTGRAAGRGATVGTADTVSSGCDCGVDGDLGFLRRRRGLDRRVGHRCRRRLRWGAHRARRRGARDRRRRIGLLDIRHEAHRLVVARLTCELELGRGRSGEILFQVVRDLRRLRRATAARRRNHRERDKHLYEAGTHLSPGIRARQRSSAAHAPAWALQCREWAKVSYGDARMQVSGVCPLMLTFLRLARGT